MNAKEKELEKVFDRLTTYNLDSRMVFERMLDFIIFCTAISDETNENFPIEIQDKITYKDKLFKDFSSENIDLFCQAIKLLGEATTDEATGEPNYYDALGDLFMAKVSSSNDGKGRNDQYFTPQCVSDLMAQINNSATLQDGQTVCDPCCGSGRFLLSVAKINPNLFFCGSDIDHLCVKMSVVNLALNGLDGEIVWGNPLTFEGWKVYQIKRHRIYGVPMIEIKNIENSIHFGEKPKIKRQEPSCQVSKIKSQQQLTLNFD
ncbi:N-6 DNA methylase [Capnocytophaga canis]|uniref:N-6 DNA methylase n=1 Tax=Capnocytophaga canis TaxID=1848903 RepID=UPI00370D8AF0